jgi:hypothetical protein
MFYPRLFMAGDFFMGKIHKRTDGKTERLCSMEKVIFSCKNASFSVDKAQKVYYNNLRDESNGGGSLSEKAFHIRVRSP